MKANDTAFTGEQYAAIYPEGIENHYWVRARNRIIARTVKRFAAGAILEVGCGKGIVTDYLSRVRGMDCRGVEPAAVTPLPTVAGKIFTGTDAAGLPEGFRRKINTILLPDVIEHLADPDSFLRELKLLFANLDAVVITVPACPELYSNYDVFNGHFRRYNLKMPGDHALRSGMSPVFRSYLFRSLYLPARLIMFLAGRRKTYMTAPKGFMKQIHRLLAYFFFLEFLLLPRKLKGTSMISVFKVG